MIKKKQKKGILKKKNKSNKRNSLSVMNGNQVNLVDVQLPKNFFENIWQMEMDIELSGEFKYDKLLALFNLYSQAIQFYSLTDPKKVKPLQNRMEGYLTKKDTLKSLSKFNIEQKAAKESNSGNNLPNVYPQVRGRAKTHFKMKAKEIKNDEIRQQVKDVLKDALILMKVDKKNLKNLINEEMEKQRDNFGDNLFRKREFNNLDRRKRRTVAVKFGRKQLAEMGNKFNSNKNGKFSKNKKLEESSSELNISKLQNENEAEFMHLLNEIDGGKSMMSDSENNGSIIGDDYKGEESSESDSDSDSEEEEEEEEDEDENEKDNSSFNSSFNNSSNFNGSLDNINNILNKSKKKENDEQLNRSKDYIMSKFKVINEIDEKEEFEQNKKEMILIEKNIQEEIENKTKKNNSSKYISALKLPPAEDEEEKKEINPLFKKEKGKEKKINAKEKLSTKFKDIINEIKDENQKPISGAKRRKSIDSENVIKKIEFDEEIKSAIIEKLRKIDNLQEGINTGEDSNLASTTSLPNVSKKNSMEPIPENFEEPILEIEERLNKYIGDLNRHFYTEMFDSFYLKLKELYDEKYNKYIKVNDEYHSNIKENEFMIENDDKMEEDEKKNIQNIIDCLKEEQKDQIDQILDEYNRSINSLMDEFKQNLFKNNVGVQLIEERLKLDVYTMINEAFY